MSRRENTPITTEALILEVKRRPAIWNITLKDYTDSAIRRQLWNEIVKILGPEGMRSDEKAQLVAELKKKWKNLRDSYFREIRRLNNIRKGYATPKRNSYLYFERLDFLRVVIETTNPSLAIERKEAQSSEHQEKDPLDVQAYHPHHKAKKKKVKVEEPLEEPVVMEVVNVGAVDTSTSSREPHEDNESDKLFLLSLLDGFRRIPESCKSAAKIDMIKLVEKYQNAVFYEYSHETGDDLTGVGSTSDTDYYTHPPSEFSDHSNDSIHSGDFKL